ncbi:hypothetical protein COCNU_01G013340 [Cocos nucifera]|uniref:Aminotransferase-like plant mobile domain-containing protein n=1 Tax=Cocos nucifera TaxID=13894 RepID=A0A8K0MVF8_COCNU|nr:hypothetical protein COCNU_01G013340 [Cocos nucifera]
MEPFLVDGVLSDIIKCHIGGDQFIIAEKIVTFSAEEVALIVGPPCHDVKISIDRKPKKERLFDKFGKRLQLQYKGLESLISQLKSLKRKEDIEDTNRLWIAYIFALFLAPKSNQTCPRDMIPFLDDLSQLGSFAWAVFIKNLGVEVLPEITDYLRSGEPRKAKRFDKGRKQPTLLGCSAALVVWFLEHTNIRSPSDPSKFSRLLRWHVCKKRSYDINFDNIQPHKILFDLPCRSTGFSVLLKRKKSTHSTDEAKLEEPIPVGCAICVQLRIEIEEFRKKILIHDKLLKSLIRKEIKDKKWEDEEEKWEEEDDEEDEAEEKRKKGKKWRTRRKRKKKLMEENRKEERRKKRRKRRRKREGRRRMRKRGRRIVRRKRRKRRRRGSRKKEKERKRMKRRWKRRKSRRMRRR